MAVRSQRRPINRQEQATAWRWYMSARRGRWLAAHAPTSKPYPCRCPEHGPACDGRPDDERPGQFFCPCAGRRSRQTHRCCGGTGPDSAWGRAQKNH